MKISKELLIGALSLSSAIAFTPVLVVHHKSQHIESSGKIQRIRTRLNADPGPPMNWAQTPAPAPTPAPFPVPPVDANDEAEEEVSLKANRWSKYAPDAELPDAEFKAQLKENMKSDLERRRAETPNRGNQPAKHYLDSL
jgi:hypothetical protein